MTSSAPFSSADTTTHSIMTFESWMDLLSSPIFPQKNRDSFLQGLQDHPEWIHHTNEFGINALMLASSMGIEEIVSLLIQKQVPIDYPDLFGWTALMMASKNGHQNIVHLLIEKGADLNKANDSGRTALMLALRYKHDPVVHELLRSQALINFQSKTGWTALMFACMFSSLEMVQCLLDAGADVTIKNYHQETALDLARKKKVHEIVHLLEAYVSEQQLRSITASAETPLNTSQPEAIHSTNMRL